MSYPLDLLASLYGRVAAQRRAWYAQNPDARRRLDRPVVSVGNLALGGSGKTPVVAALARWLRAEGERPSILSRGYGRRSADGVVVVSDPVRVIEPVRRSGDEPQFLARALPGVPVLAGSDRHLAGRLAERRFGCTVHLLDDGFQHVQLSRDIDLLLVSPEDGRDRVVPAGRLRERIEAAAAADALLVTAAQTVASGFSAVTDVASGFPGPSEVEGSRKDREGEEDLAAASATFGVPTAFRLVPRFGAARLLEPFGALLPPVAGARALAVAGIARPQRFFDAARRHGWDVVKEIAFRDHHWFDAGDLRLMLAAARAANADVILTTEKDAMRLLDLPLAPIPRTFAFLPMNVAIEPAAAFEAWLRERLESARASVRPRPDAAAEGAAASRAAGRA